MLRAYLTRFFVPHFWNKGQDTVEERKAENQHISVSGCYYNSSVAFFCGMSCMQNDSFFFYRISSSHIFNSVCWSHALVNGPTSKRPASDGGRCSGQLLMMWSAVCSGSPHSHAALSASPHFFMEALYRPTPVRSLLRSSSVFDSVILP